MQQSFEASKAAADKQIAEQGSQMEAMAQAASDAELEASALRDSLHKMQAEARLLAEEKAQLHLALVQQVFVVTSALYTLQAGRNC